MKELNGLNNDIRSGSDTLERMNTGFGPDAEWKKLDGTCVDKISGECVDVDADVRCFVLMGISYTYEVCFFGRTTQKSNKDSSSNNLGYVPGGLGQLSLREQVFYGLEHFCGTWDIRILHQTTLSKRVSPLFQHSDRR